jgi:hypothetical protein
LLEESFKIPVSWQTTKSAMTTSSPWPLNFVVPKESAKVFFFLLITSHFRKYNIFETVNSSCVDYLTKVQKFFLASFSHPPGKEVRGVVLTGVHYLRGTMTTNKFSN